MSVQTGTMTGIRSVGEANTFSGIRISSSSREFPADASVQLTEGALDTKKECEKSSHTKSLLDDSVPWERSYIHFITKSETQPQIRPGRCADRVYLAHSSFEDRAFTFDGDDISIFSDASSVNAKKSQFVHRPSLFQQASSDVLADPSSPPDSCTDTAKSAKNVSFKVMKTPESPNTVAVIADIVGSLVATEEQPIQRSNHISEDAQTALPASDDDVQLQGNDACMCIGYHDMLSMLFPPRHHQVGSYRLPFLPRPLKPMDGIMEESRIEH